MNTIVVAIIGILVAIALPVFLGQRAKAADARAQANVREAATAINVFFTENGGAPDDATAPTCTPPDPVAGVTNITAETCLSRSGFNGSTPKVDLTAIGTADSAAWCVTTLSNGGNSAVWYQNQAVGEPKGVANAAALPAGCPDPA